MRLVALPGEITAWHRQLASVPDNRRHAVIRWLSEVLADCDYCGDPIRRSDSRGFVVGRPVHLRCAPHLTPGQQDALAHRELVDVAHGQGVSVRDLEAMAPDELRPEPPFTVIPTGRLLRWAKESLT
jgi:hypothetical protein